MNTSYFNVYFLDEIETVVVLTHPGQTYALQFLAQCVPDLFSQRRPLEISIQ